MSEQTVETRYALKHTSEDLYIRKSRTKKPVAVNSIFDAKTFKTAYDCAVFGGGLPQEMKDNYDVVTVNACWTLSSPPQGEDLSSPSDH